MKQKQQKCVRQQTQQQFAKILERDHNSECFQCGMHCNQWVETRHAIFLCFKCANQYGDLSRVCNIKSASLDRWTNQDLNRLKRGGNNKFREYLIKYDLQDSPAQTYLNSKAAQFYRLYLLNPTKLELKDAPDRDAGCLVQASKADITSAVSGELLQEAKERLSSAASATLYYGSRAYETLHEKLENAEVRESAMKAVDKATETAHSIWKFMASKLELQREKENIAV